MNKVFLAGIIAMIIIGGVMGLFIWKQNQKAHPALSPAEKVTVSITLVPTSNPTSSSVSASSDIDAELKAFEDSLQNTNESDFDKSGLSDKELGL